MSHLSLCPLEGRAVPATFAYSAALQKLTITAAQGDQIAVTQLNNQPTGYIGVAAGATPVFSSDTDKAPVRSLTVIFTGADAGSLTVETGVALGGNLVVAGARLNQFVTLNGVIGGSVTYTSTPGAFDDITVAGTARVGGNLILAVNGGDDVVRLKGGTVMGGLAVTGGAGADTVEFAADGDLTIGGSAALRLGDGANVVRGLGVGRLVTVGGSLSYTGGTGNDAFRPDAAGVSLRVGGDARFTFGSGRGFDNNVAEFEGLSVGRNLTFTGTAGADAINVTGPLQVGGGVAANLGTGPNGFAATGAGSTVGTTLTYAGQIGTDAVTLDNLSVGRNVSVNLGDGANQSFTGGPGGLNVYGSLSVKAGSGADAVTIRKGYVGWNLSVNGGAGNDAVTLDDLAVAGLTTFDLGAGNDTLAVETTAAATGVTSFGSTVTVKAGDGDDTVNLSDDSDATTLVRFGGKLHLLSGLGADILRDGPENTVAVSGGAEDFETGNL
ncbi:MAG TPA: hypothetical protein VM597_16385 [Gemmataceae bacterium]|nr:hypothetical protein [Gemmataceae bacterium]